MAIDPRMYEKYSGRSGDPYKRMGEALAGQAARKQATRAVGDRSFSERVVVGHFKAKWMMSIIGAIIMLILAASAVFRF